MIEHPRALDARLRGGYGLLRRQDRQESIRRCRAHLQLGHTDFGLGVAADTLGDVYIRLPQSEIERLPRNQCAHRGPPNAAERIRAQHGTRDRRDHRQRLRHHQAEHVVVRGRFTWPRKSARGR